MVDTVNINSRIGAVKTPLNFLVVVLFFVEVTVASLAYAISDEYRGILVWTVALSVPGFALLVTGLAIWRPEALSGNRPLHALHADKFANDLFNSIDGALQNLPDDERNEAWSVFEQVMKPDSYTDKVYADFCTTVVATIMRSSGIRSGSLKPRGRIPK